MPTKPPPSPMKRLPAHAHAGLDGDAHRGRADGLDLVGRRPAGRTAPSRGWRPRGGDARRPPAQRRASRAIADLGARGEDGDLGLARGRRQLVGALGRQVLGPAVSRTAGVFWRDRAMTDGVALCFQRHAASTRPPRPRRPGGRPAGWAWPAARPGARPAGGSGRLRPGRWSRGSSTCTTRTPIRAPSRIAGRGCSRRRP